MNNEIEEMLEPVPEEQMIAWPGHPIVIPGQWPVYMVSPHRLRFWCAFDVDGDPSALSCLANIAHPAACAVDDAMLKWTLDPNWKLQTPDMCLRLGIAPDQPFQIELFADYYTDDYGETDIEIEWEIVQVQPMHPREVLKKLMELGV